MKFIEYTRKQEIKKFYNKMTEKERKFYLKDWVAPHEITDYLANNLWSCVNKQVYFYRQCAYQHS